MNHGPLIVLGALLTLATSWCGLVLVPQLQLGRQEPLSLSLPGQTYPTARPGQAAQGLEVYRSLGCAQCHSQQLRPGTASDIARAWGRRRTVAQDYLFDQPVMAGSARIGPDLANLGARDPKHFAVPWEFQIPSNQVQELTRWHYLHLYKPRAVAPGSVMPPYRFLFEELELKYGRGLSADALMVRVAATVPGQLADGRREIVPTPEARALVAYLMSLRADTSLFEAPLPRAPTLKQTNPVADTNTPSATTNAPPP